MNFFTILFVLLTSPVFAQGEAEAINMALQNKDVAKSVQAKLKDGYRLNNNSAALISYAFGDEGYSNQYIVSISMEKGNLPYDKQTELITAFVNTDFGGNGVTLLDTQKMAKAVRKSLEPEDEIKIVQKFFTNLLNSHSNKELEDQILNLESWGYRSFGEAQVSLLAGLCGVSGCNNRYLVTLYISTTKANPMTTAVGAIIDSNIVTGDLRLTKVLKQDFITDLIML